jgi:hypothetical protein
MQVMLRVTILLAVLVVARTAQAACAPLEPHLGTMNVPLGCQISVYFLDAGLTPKAFAQRGDARVDVTGAVTSESASVPIFIEEDACTGEGTESTVPVTHYRIALAGAVAGDILFVDGLLTGAATVAAAGPCPMPVEPSSQYCPDDTPASCDEGGGSPAGCAAGREVGIAFACLALWLARRQRRQRDTARPGSVVRGTFFS